MQLHAHDSDGRLIWAGSADRQRDYTCLECGSVVRLRGGLHRQNHFFHLEVDRPCRLSGKSMCHLQVQCYLQALFPQGECQLEYRFPNINRIADVVWLKHRFVFEIQCSPITKEELEQRNRDYQSAGYQEIWIFHDQQFNRRRITAAEQTVAGKTFYYTNIDRARKGKIYDQYHRVELGIRTMRTAHLAVDLSKPHYLTANEWQHQLSINSFPQVIKDRMQNGLFHFEGDLLSSALKRSYCREAATFWEIIDEEELSLSMIEPPLESATNWSIKYLFQRFIAIPYRIIFQMLLEKSCQ